MNWRKEAPGWRKPLSGGEAVNLFGDLQSMLPDIQTLNFNSLIERAEVHFKPKAKVKEKIAVIFFFNEQGEDKQLQ